MSDFEALVEKTDEIPTGRIPDRIENERAAIACVVWETTPKKERELTVTQLAETVGVGRKTYYRWKDQQWYQALCRHEVMKHLAEERREIYDALAEEAKSGDVKAIQMYSELMGDHVKQIDVTSGGESVSDEDARSMMTDDLVQGLIDEKIQSASIKRKIEDMDASTEEIGQLLIELLEQ